MRLHECVTDDLLLYDQSMADLEIHTLQHLASLNRRQIKQLGLADEDPASVAVAVFKLLHLNPALPQHQNVATCQFNANKLSVVDNYSPNGKVKLSVPSWVAKPKEEVLQDLLNEIADAMTKGLVDTRVHSFSQKQTQSLEFFVEHTLRPWEQSWHPDYEKIFRAGRSLHEQRNTLCDVLCRLLDEHTKQRGHRSFS